LSSYLIRLCEHFFKLCYWESDRDRCFRGWSLEISNFRVRTNLILRGSPSLKRYLEENFLADYTSARRLFLKASDFKHETVPEQPWFTLEQALDDDWLPEQPDSETID
ncbi:MAG: DUF29 domain-containing protein, partial [Nodosilinea sp.]